MTKPGDCEHENLYFGSGDYYVFCQECGAGWCRVDMMKHERCVTGNKLLIHQPAPEIANKGKGALLSGQHRYRVDAGLDCTHEQLRAHIDQTLKDPLLRAVVLAMLGLN